MDDLGYNDNMLVTKKAQHKIEKVDKLDFIKTKNFSSAKDTVRRLRQATH